MPECKCTTHIISIFVKKNTFLDITLFIYLSISKWQNQKVDVWVILIVIGYLVTPFQSQILRAAANNMVCGHASMRGHARTSSTLSIPFADDESKTISSAYMM